MYSCMLVEYILYIIMVGWINGCFLQENCWKLDSHCSIGLIFFKKRLKTLHFWSIAMTNQLNVDTAHWKSNAFVKAKKVPLRQISTISLSGTHTWIKGTPFSAKKSVHHTHAGKGLEDLLITSFHPQLKLFSTWCFKYFSFETAPQQDLCFTPPKMFPKQAQQSNLPGGMFLRGTTIDCSHHVQRIQNAHGRFNRRSSFEGRLVKVQHRVQQDWEKVFFNFTTENKGNHLENGCVF